MSSGENLTVSVRDTSLGPGNSEATPGTVPGWGAGGLTVSAAQGATVASAQWRNVTEYGGEFSVLSGVE